MTELYFGLGAAFVFISLLAIVNNSELSVMRKRIEALERDAKPRQD